MKKIFILIIGIIISSVLYAQEKNALIVKLTDGNTNTFVLSDRPVVTMLEGNVTISGSASATYLRSEVEKFYFDFVDVTGVEFVYGENIMVHYVDGENVRITGLKENVVAILTTLDGKVINTQKSDAIGRVVISLKNYPKGVYIISLGNRNVKIKK